MAFAAEQGGNKRRLTAGMGRKAKPKAVQIDQHKNLTPISLAPDRNR